MKWNIDKVIIEARKYSFKNEFRRNSGAYQWAIKNAKYDIRIWGHFLVYKKSSKYNVEMVTSLARKYKTRNEFQKSKNHGAYIWCFENGHLKNKLIFGHMVKAIRGKWNFKNTSKEARRYNSRKEFEINAAGAYKWARTNKCIDAVCKHMKKNFIDWNLDLIIEIAKKYTSKGNFITDNSGAYGWIVRNNHKNDESIFGHMAESVKWNLEKVINASKLYATKTEFQKSNHKTAYLWCHRNQELDNILIFGHMANGMGGFDCDKPAILYYLKICDGLAYKIGITNRTVLDRFCKKDLSNIKVLSIIEYANGIDAKREETRILKEYLDAKYNGKKLLKDGNSELFRYDILNLDEEN